MSAISRNCDNSGHDRNCRPCPRFHYPAAAQDRLRQSGLPESADRLRTDPDPALRRGLHHVQDLCRRGSGHRQHLRLHRRRRQGKPGYHRRSAGRKRQGDRHRLPGCQERPQQRQPGQGNPPQRARRYRPARHAGSDGRRTHPLPQAPRSLPGSGARRFRRSRSQAHTQALRLPENQRGLQPPLHLLHHPFHARRPGQSTDRRCAERSAGPVRRWREGVAGGQPGHLCLRRGREIPHRLLGW